ncbi:hypothetical protein AVEN_22243-1 [Araneus ventricosus]|uniref:BTB domain-containing protein n=1 Tax=Araneus ventricosus TaxID=182803 RepID=A0A4Y2G011_ARAVE|nr:hypothetical protein AVEN_22243-1 [Araneus ventricosus]
MSLPSTSFDESCNSGSWEGMQQFTNGTLQTDDGKTCRIHRLVLSQSSEYFHPSFSFSLNQEMIVMHNINSKTLKSILQYIYTGTIKLDEKNVCDLMIASDYLPLDDLVKSYG